MFQVQCIFNRRLKISTETTVNVVDNIEEFDASYLNFITKPQVSNKDEKVDHRFNDAEDES